MAYRLGRIDHFGGDVLRTGTTKEHFILDGKIPCRIEVL